jgi:phosphatidylglycerophosphatase A
MLNSSVWVPVATLGPLGYTIASGTIGSLVGLIIVWFESFLPLSMHLPFIGISIVSSFYIIAYAAQHFTCHDPKEIIIDEVIGCMIAFYGIPLTFWPTVWCFLLFRFFDITKIFGIRNIEKLSTNSWTILADDIVAALFANLCVRLFL